MDIVYGSLLFLLIVMPFQRILNKIAGDYNEKQMKKLLPLVARINAMCDEWDMLSDDDIRAKTDEFKQRIAGGETLDDIMIEAFAAVKQACKRMQGLEVEVKGETIPWNMVPYDVQILGGIILHQGKIAEMRTGEGKTLVATFPAYLNALSGKGVHVVTVNDYLASRDAERMGHLYMRLGISVGSVTKQTPIGERRKEYEKDITYIENSELGFDYLRDNLATTVRQRNVVWRPLHFALIDEVDSILIDEARTPLIISQASDEPTEKYQYYARLVQLLTPSKVKKKVSKGFLNELLKDSKGDVEEDDGGDYYIDEKTKSVTLSSVGIKKLEGLLNVENLYKDLGFQEIHHIENALRAQAVYHNDKDYLIKDGQVLIVDDHTGRVMPGRRYSEGLHQAIEAKEQVEVQRESKTLATITYQHFFKQYQKLAGMTGTASTEAEEFEKIYSLEVATIPTNNPIIRVDKNDMVYFNQDAKRKAVVDHITFYHEIGVPILIGTSSIYTSELVSTILRKMALTHSVLNAKFHEQEAKIVASAGKEASIVVATNMAGRGTDIKLDKRLIPNQAEKYATYIDRQVKKGNGVGAVVFSSLEFERTIEALKHEFGLSDEQIRAAEKGRTATDRLRFKIVFNTTKKNNTQPFAQLRCEALEKTDTSTVEERDFHYGLFILGTEKHDSRRIDNQLRGRAGRQGDPGVSQFFVAMDDEIMRKMGGDRIQSIARMMLSKDELESLAFTQKQFTNSILRSQKQMEGRHFGIRKHLFDYDSVINKQRTRIYAKRDEILGVDADEPTEEILGVEHAEVPQPVSLTVVDEIRYFIDEVVENLVKTYTSMNPRKISELLESLQEITGVTFLEEEYATLRSASSLEETLTTQLHESFTALLAEVDAFKLQKYCKRVYLQVIDKHRMQHITDMQYLREKVGLYGYAQIDPLVVYKKEAFDKFQTMLFMIKKETLGTIFRTDFVTVQQAEKIAVQLQQQGGSSSMLDMLKAVTQGLHLQQPPQKITQSGAQGETVAGSDDDGSVEVLEVSDESSPMSGADTSAVKEKLRPNDKVTVQYTDGRKEYDVKRKKVKDDVETGKAKIL